MRNKWYFYYLHDGQGDIRHIGSTQDPEVRLQIHFKKVNFDFHPCPELAQWFEEMNRKQITIQLNVFAQGLYTHKQALRKEAEYSHQYRELGYNISPYYDGSYPTAIMRDINRQRQLGKKRTKEQRLTIGKASKSTPKSKARKVKVIKDGETTIYSSPFGASKKLPFSNHLVKDACEKNRTIDGYEFSWFE